MRFASSITDIPDTARAIEALLAPIDRQVTLGMVDLVCLFATADYDEELPQVVEAVEDRFPQATVLGTTAYGTLGVGKELERLPSMTLLAACLPDVNIFPFHLRQAAIEAAEDADAWERLVGVSPESEPVFLAWGDPFRVDITRFVEQINKLYPGVPLFGGISSAAHQPGDNRLILNGEIHEEGIVGVALTGNLRVDGVVSQGCRPIGRHFVVTKGEQNIVQELGGHPPLAQLYAVLKDLSAEDKALARQSLLMGRVIDEYKTDFARGDFLIHNILGADRRNGAMQVAGPVRVGSTVQFHVRDAASADEDLREHLSEMINKGTKGALMFGCNGRGTHMWPYAGHDVNVFRELIGEIPLAGFFAAGEFGPVGGRNFVHGFTASIAMFRER